jgi:hypothetical protein
MTYLCKDCGTRAITHTNTEQIERFIGLAKTATKVTVRGLGTWFCPQEQKKTKVKRER